MKKFFLTPLFVLLFSTVVFGQNQKKPAASPHQIVTQDFALSKITVDYCRPGVKGRTIFGELVPYNKVWRTGANAVTTIDFEKDVKLEGHAVKAGKYAVYSIPSENEWTIILNKDVKNWGLDYKEADDVLRFKVSPEYLPFQVETFTINFDQIKDTSAVLYLVWDHTYVPIRISTSL